MLLNRHRCVRGYSGLACLAVEPYIALQGLTDSRLARSKPESIVALHAVQLALEHWPRVRLGDGALFPHRSAVITDDQQSPSLLPKLAENKSYIFYFLSTVILAW